VAAARLLRRERIGLLRPAPDSASGSEVAVRPLADYDAAFGLADGGVA
jgi:hypothetical protein